MDAYQAFVPAALPPDPPLKLTAADHDLIERANRALGKLDGMTSLLPNTALFIYAYVRKEAIVSSQIEGTQSSFSDLLLYESDQAPGVPIEDVREVSDYVAALDHGLKRLRGGFPLSLRLMREIHAVLLRSGAATTRHRASFAEARFGSANERDPRPRRARAALRFHEPLGARFLVAARAAVTVRTVGRTNLRPSGNHQDDYERGG